MISADLLTKIVGPLLTAGYVAIGAGHSTNTQEYWIRLIHKETFSVVVVSEEITDDEEFFRATFGIDDEDAEEHLREHMHLPCVMHVKEEKMLQDKFLNWDDGDFKAMVQKLILENEVKLP